MGKSWGGYRSFSRVPGGDWLVMGKSKGGYRNFPGFLVVFGWPSVSRGVVIETFAGSLVVFGWSWGSHGVVKGRCLKIVFIGTNCAVLSQHRRNILKTPPF